jgi:hypothetical protein
MYPPPYALAALRVVTSSCAMAGKTDERNIAQKKAIPFKRGRHQERD